MDYRKVAKAFAAKHNLEYSENRPITYSVSVSVESDLEEAFDNVVARMLRVYGVDRYVYEMWSEIVDKNDLKFNFGKVMTAAYAEWGVDCGYCAVIRDCKLCPLKSCWAGSAYDDWCRTRDLSAAKEIRDTANKENI